MGHGPVFVSLDPSSVPIFCFHSCCETSLGDLLLTGCPGSSIGGFLDLWPLGYAVPDAEKAFPAISCSMDEPCSRTISQCFPFPSPLVQLSVWWPPFPHAPRLGIRVGPGGCLVRDRACCVSVAELAAAPCLSSHPRNFSPSFLWSSRSPGEV